MTRCLPTYTIIGSSFAGGSERGALRDARCGRIEGMMGTTSLREAVDGGATAGLTIEVTFLATAWEAVGLVGGEPTTEGDWAFKGLEGVHRRILPSGENPVGNESGVWGRGGEVMKA